MTTTNATPTTSTSNTSTAQAAGAIGSQQLAGNFNTFLTLLTTQLQNQDPLSPLDTNQFTQQLVEFASVEQQVNMNTNLQTLISMQQTSASLQALQLLQSQQTQLERALEQAGLKTADNGLQFTLRDQSFTGQNGGSGNGAQPSAAQLVIPDAEAPVIQATQIYSRSGLGSGVDIRV